MWHCQLPHNCCYLRYDMNKLSNGSTNTNVRKILLLREIGAIHLFPTMRQATRIPRVTVVLLSTFNLEYFNEYLESESRHSEELLL